jgi:hypothetical protein
MKLHRIAWIASAVTACAFAQPAHLPEQEVTASRSGSLAVVTQANRELNTKKLRIGDMVSVKVIQALVSGGKVVIPRGAKLIGHVADLTALTKSEPQSRLALIFDRAELKGGSAFPLRGYVQAVGPPLVDPELEAVMSSSRYSGAVSGHPVNGEPLSAGQTSFPAVMEPLHGTGVNGLQQREQELNKAEHQRRNERTPQGALESANHGVFGLSGLALDNAAPVPILVAAGKNIDLKEGTQIVLRLADSFIQQ